MEAGRMMGTNPINYGALRKNIIPIKI